MKTSVPCLSAVLLLAALGGALGADADVDFERLARSAPSGDRYPGADAAYLLLDVHVRVDPAGSETLALRRAVKIFNAQGRREFGDYRMLFDSDTQTLTVKTARTIRDNFRMIDLERDAINDITPVELEGASIYSNVLERVFSYPGALTGSVFALDLERRTAAGGSGVVGGSFLFQADQPILEARFTLTVPAGTDAVYEMTHLPPGWDGRPDIESTGGETHYRWEVKDVPRAVPEAGMPPEEAVYPRLVYSTAAEWAPVAAFFSDLFFGKAVVEGELSGAVERWLEGTHGDEEKIREIYLHVVSEVRSVRLDLGRGGYEPHPAATVYHNRYGDCRDKAVLIVAALEKAGLRAYPVLYDHRPVDLVEGVPTLRQFNDVMVAVTTPAGYRFLDPMAEHCLYGYYPRGGGNRALLVKRDGFEHVTIPEIPPDRNLSRKTLAARIDADGSAEGSVQCALAGYFDHEAREFLAEKTAREREMELSAAVNRVAEGAVLTRTELGDLDDATVPITVLLGFSAEDFGRVQGEMMILRLPEFPLPYANLPLSAGLAERAFDDVVGSTAHEEYRVELTIPDGYRALWVPPPWSAVNEVGRFDVESTVDAGARTIVVTRRIVLETAIVPKAQYPQLKAALDAVDSPKNALVLLEKSGPRPGVPAKAGKP